MRATEPQLDALGDRVADELDLVLDGAVAELRAGRTEAAARALVRRRYLQRLADEIDASGATRDERVESMPPARCSRSRNRPRRAASRARRGAASASTSARRTAWSRSRPMAPPRACFADERGNALLPSVVDYTGDPPQVGAVARARELEHPTQVISSVKRFMGRGSADSTSRTRTCSPSGDPRALRGRPCATGHRRRGVGADPAPSCAPAPRPSSAVRSTGR